MRILLPGLNAKGIVTIQAHTPDGRLIHEEVQDNLITSWGFSGITGLKLADELLNTCILGRNATAPNVGDTFFGPASQSSFTDLYIPSCPDSPPGVACQAAPTRSIVARSTDNGGEADVYAHDEVEDYWSITRKRVFEYDDAYFLGGDSSYIAATCAQGQTAWALQGWGLLAKEASFIKELGFCSGTVQPRPFVRSCVTVPEWSTDAGQTGKLWNRVVLNQSIGFESATPWATPDVELDLTAVITVTLEVRIYYNQSTVTQGLTINGVPTTVTTRVQRITDVNAWGVGGLMRYFGRWHGDGDGACIGESNTLPATGDGYFPDGGSAQIVSSGVGWVDPVYTRKYTVAPSQGNWVGGIGGMAHANFHISDNKKQCYVTTFDPKIVKTSLEEVYFDIAYTWGQKP